jgi:hypothetical protein
MSRSGPLIDWGIFESEKYYIFLIIYYEGNIGTPCTM